MVTPRKKPALRAAPPPDDEPDEIVGLLPMNRNGEVITGRGAWQMPAGGMPGDADDPGAEFEVDDQPETPADRIMAMLADVGDDPRAFVKVSRISNTGKIGWCEDVPVAEFELGGMTRIRDKWGAGNFQVILYGMQPGTKRFVIRTRAQIEIVPTAPGAPSAPGQQANELAPILEQLLQRLGTQAAPVSPDEQMMKMLTMMKLMREAMGETGQKSGSSMEDTLKLVRELKGATKLFEKGSDEEKEDGPMGMLTKLLPGIMAAVAQKQAAPQAMSQAPQQPLALPAPQPQEEAPLLAPGVEQMMSPFEAIKLRGTLTTLLALAANNAAIPESAEYLLQNLPDQFMDMMETDDWWTALVGVAPAVAPHGVWFANVRAQAIAFLDEDEANAQDEQTAADLAGDDTAAPAVDAAPAAPPPVPTATITPAKRGKKPAAAADVDTAA